jgi:restriction system protein
MPRRKTLLDEVLDILFRISIIYVIALFFIWFSNKALFFRLLLWGLVFFGILIIIALFIKRSKIHKQSQWRTDRDLLYWLKGMKPWEFEHYISELFTKLGYKTTVTGGSYDKGVDVIAEKDGLKHYIQCKKYITSTVGVNELREFYGAIADHLAQAKGYFITTNKFTLEAEKFTEDKPIELIDGYKLIKYIRMAEKSK